jgi:hypothetical protein
MQCQGWHTSFTPDLILPPWAASSGCLCKKTSSEQPTFDTVAGMTRRVGVVVVRGGLATVGDGGERRWYSGMVDEVGGKARMQIFNDLPCAVAKIDGVKVGGGGGGLS